MNTISGFWTDRSLKAEEALQAVLNKKHDKKISKNENKSGRKQLREKRRRCH